MRVEEVKELVIDGLGTLLGVERVQLVEELQQAGPDMPYDSVVLAELLVVLEAELDISVPMDARTERSLRSVSALAERLTEVLRAGRKAA